MSARCPGRDIRRLIAVSTLSLEGSGCLRYYGSTKEVSERHLVTCMTVNTSSKYYCCLFNLMKRAPVRLRFLRIYSDRGNGSIVTFPAFDEACNR